SARESGCSCYAENTTSVSLPTSHPHRGTWGLWGRRRDNARSVTRFGCEPQQIWILSMGRVHSTSPHPHIHLPTFFIFNFFSCRIRQNPRQPREKMVPRFVSLSSLTWHFFVSRRKFRSR